MIEVTANDSFVHGQYMLDKGQKQEMPKGIADDLVKVGLVTLHETKQAPAPQNKMAPDAANKAEPEPELADKPAKGKK